MDREMKTYRPFTEIFSFHSRSLTTFIRLLAGILSVAVAVHPLAAMADEGGVSFWLPGTYGSLAAVPQTPGWSMGAVYYHASVGSSGSVAASREVTVGRFNPTVNVNLNVNLNAKADLVLLAPTYTFATPVLGGQFALGMTGIFGKTSADVNGTLTAVVGGVTATRFGSIGDSLTSVGDLYPTATLRWNSGVDNFMTYVTGDIPVGAYDPNRLANIGMGHGAIDAGGGYTYFNPQTGREFSAVGGFTYNFTNPDTQYQSGVDFHVDWAASQFLSKQLFVGLAGYFYEQVTADKGANPLLGDFKSRVAAVGPQVGYIFPVGDMQGYLNLKGYGEFDAHDRPSGYNVWLTFAISPAAPTPPTTRAPMFHT